MSLQSSNQICRLTPAIEGAITASWNPVCHITYTRDTWVKLLQSPGEYAFAEAKLLCQESSDTWLAWVPDHGEVLLDQSDFYC
ncbi:hypothetical protein [Chroogloeocystis siderophila]|jgi:hypothetical protein|uniref:Uncharacterized protein n=1 Tax=Chroogloeocystis siderophila 5.2 s.c.1 TaxID=247279 RepID=A0A1U7HXM0_9CHRO|nr:hypothetical protein [Chroogloeocystis siderophila]OKH28394.1 hypothetical protein NIES1031_03910 [Chroogloeocystis siderophila 5.2 s.c.1]